MPAGRTSSMPVGRRNVAVFDERRNSSRVFPVPPHALRDAVRALEQLRRDDVELVSWIEAGAPRLTHDEHRRRFGADWAPSSSRRGRGRA